MSEVVSVIMAGGKGERFWPFSRRNNPKQLLPLVSEKALLAETVQRVLPLTEYKGTLIASNRRLAPRIQDLLPDLPQENLLAEPIGRDTAPCVTFAAHVVKKRFGEDAVMVLLSADHHVEKVQRFRGFLEQAISSARAGYLTTIGVTPTRAETGYGYLHLGVPHTELGESVREVRRFVEKPELTVAREMFESKEYLWNAGMFAWKASTILQAVEEYLPDVAGPFKDFAPYIDTPEMESKLKEVFESVPKISIDFGVMEKADGVMTVQASDIGWDDLGSWLVMERMHAGDDCGNVVIAEHVGFDTENCIIAGSGGLVVTIGVKDLLVVREDDVVLVAKKDCGKELKEVLKQLDGHDRFRNLL